MPDSSSKSIDRRLFLGTGLLAALLGVTGCGDPGSNPAPPKAPGKTGNRDLLGKFKENATAALSKQKKKKP
jgi:hypothetical protein